MSVEAAPLLGWHSTGSSRLVPLGASRIAAQVLGLVWFMVAARELESSVFGDLAVGMAFAVAFAALGDLGTTRTVTRHVAGGGSSVWAAYQKSVVLRVLGGVGVAVPAACVVGLLFDQPPAEIVAVAGVLAIVSGITELGYAALRSTGRVTTELIWLPLERGLFLAIGWLAVDGGAGAVAILWVFVGTNLLSALAAGVAVRRLERRGGGGVPPMLDAEARRSAVGFALLALGPRVTPLILSVLASSATVATFAVAWRPVESISLLAISLVTPVLPMLRSLHVRGRAADLDRAVRSVRDAIVIVLLPVALWFLIAPEQPVELLTGGTQYEDAVPLLRILALVVITWFIRGLAEATLLAREQARVFATITVVGFAITAAAGPVLIAAFDAPGAAFATLAAELVMALLVFVTVPSLRRRARGHSGVHAALIGIAAGAAVLASLASPLIGAAFIAVATALAALAAARELAALERQMLAVGSPQT